MVYFKIDVFLDLIFVFFVYFFGVVINLYFILLGVKGKLD